MPQRIVRLPSLAVQSGLYLLQLGQSRRHEYEADQLAVALGSSAGMSRQDGKRMGGGLDGWSQAGTNQQRTALPPAVGWRLWSSWAHFCLPPHWLLQLEFELRDSLYPPVYAGVPCCLAQGTH